MFDFGKTSHCALLFGHHQTLLETRKRLLIIIGCGSTIAQDLKGFQRSLLQYPIELVVLCQSATDAERSRAVAMALQCRPEARMLMLCSSSRWRDPGTDGALLDAMAGPRQFLVVARQMLEPGAMPA